VLLMRESDAKAAGLKPLARILAHATHAQDPAWFTTAPIGAMQKVLDKTGWTVGDVDLFEINEAFAVVTMAAMRDLGLSHDKVNVHGGALCAGPPDRCVRYPHCGLADLCLAAIWQETWRCQPVYWRRRGDSTRYRTDLIHVDRPARRIAIALQAGLQPNTGAACRSPCRIP
jgi:hypothetical protein